MTITEEIYRLVKTGGTDIKGALTQRDSKSGPYDINM